MRKFDGFLDDEFRAIITLEKVNLLEVVHHVE